MEAQLVLIGAEVIAVGGMKGLNMYLKHRQKMKDDGHEDALLTFQIKKVGNDIMEGVKSRFSSRDNTPVRNRDSEDEPSLTDTYPEEKSVDENDENTARLSVAESVLNSIPKLRLSKSKPKNSAVNFISNLMQKKEVKKSANKVFEEFVLMLLRFVSHELITQEEQPNHILQEHRHYTAKLLKSLELQQRKKK